MRPIYAVTLALFAAACVLAYAQRGYLAIGGEIFILLIPAMRSFARIAMKEVRE